MRRDRVKLNAAGGACRIGVLDGIRVFAIGIVAWFHFWQQNWMMPEIGNVSLSFLPRYGYLLVDMMVLLSAFSLFLPYAREMVYGQRVSGGARDFYVRRLARIAPSYYVVLFVVLFIELGAGVYGGVSEVLDDLVPHIFFLHNLFPNSYIYTHLDGALWTVAVLAQLYLFFPLMARAFVKKPQITYVVMFAVSLVSTMVILRSPEITEDTAKVSMLANNTFSFVAVYANGILGAWGYNVLEKMLREKLSDKKNSNDAGESSSNKTEISKTKSEKIKTESIEPESKHSKEGKSEREREDTRRRKFVTSCVQPAFTIGALACMYFYRLLCANHEDAVREGYEQGQLWQLKYRFLLSIVFLVFILCVCFSVRAFQKIFDNRVMRFLAGVSFNFYMVHQYLAAKLREWDFPAIDGDGPGEASMTWRWEYLIAVTLISLALAILLTYLVEKPAAKLIKRRFIKIVRKQGYKIENIHKK